MSNNVEGKSSTSNPLSSQPATVVFSQLLKPLPNLRERCTDLLLRAKTSAAKKEECLQKVALIMKSVESQGEIFENSPAGSNFATPVRNDRGGANLSSNSAQDQTGVFGVDNSTSATFAKWEMTIEECAEATSHHLATANVLATKSEGCAHTAERSSSAVKRLDTLHSRVKWAREIVKRISETRTCISTIARALSQVSFDKNELQSHVPRSPREEGHINDAIAAFSRYVQSNQKLLELCKENNIEELPFIDYQVLQEPTQSLIFSKENEEEEDTIEGAFEPWLVLQAAEGHVDNGSGGEEDEGENHTIEAAIRTQGDHQGEQASLARSIASRAQKLLFTEVSGRLLIAMTTGPREAVLASVESLASMGSYNETMKVFIHWVCSVSLAELASLVDNELGELKTAKNTEKSHLYSSSVALDHVVATLEREEEFVTSVFGNAGLIELLRHLHKRCTQHVARVIQDYLSRQHHIASGPNVAAKDLDRTLEEISHLVSCCQMYMSYVDGRYKEATANLENDSQLKEASPSPSTTHQQSSTSQPSRSDKFASFVTDDNPLFEAIQSLLGVYIPMQQQYFRVAVSQTLQNDEESSNEFQESEIKKLETIAKENCIVTKKAPTAASGKSQSSAFTLPFTFAAGTTTDPANQSILVGRLESLLQAAAASTTLSRKRGNPQTNAADQNAWFSNTGNTVPYSPFDPPGTSKGQPAELRQLMNSICAAPVVFGGTKSTASQVLQADIPDVAFIDDMFYVLRIALYRAFATKNPAITSAVLLNILTIINEEIAKEVIETRLGGQILPNGSFPYTSRRNSSKNNQSTYQKKTHEAVYFYDSSVEAYFATLLDTGSDGGGRSSYSNIQSSALSPAFLKWLLAATQLPAYTRRLAGDIHKAANAAYGGTATSPHEANINSLDLKKFLELQHNFEDLANCLEQNVDHLVFLTAGATAQMFLDPLQVALSPSAATPMYLSKCSISDFNISPDLLQRYFARSESSSALGVFIDPTTGLATSSRIQPNQRDNVADHRPWLENALPQWINCCEYIRYHLLVRNEELYERLMTHLVGWLTTQFETSFLLPLIPRNWLTTKVTMPTPTTEELGDVSLNFVGRFVDVDGALQLDEDVRALKAFFIESSEIPPVRDKFSRLTAISTLMVVDNIRDAIEVSATLTSLSRVDKARMLASKLELDKHEIIRSIL